MARIVFSKFFAALLLLSTMSGCVETLSESPGGDSRILAMGDSLMAWNSNGRNSISHVLERALQEDVLDRSVPGAQIVYDLPISGALGFRISNQYVDGDWDWVILNGGGNDLYLGCGCGKCGPQMFRMISQDGTVGEIPHLVSKLRRTGAKVIYLGYLRTPGKDSPIDRCATLGNDFEGRLQAMAKRDSGVFFLSAANVVPHGDLSYHAEDRIHPSSKGSAAIASMIARVIKQNEG